MNAEKNKRQGTDRLPPHSTEAEQGLLGCLLTQSLDGGVNPGIKTCRDKFQADEVFYDLRHQTIWHAITYLAGEGKPIDIITVQQELNSRALLDQVGGIPYLSSLQDSVPSLANLPTYVDIVWEKYIFRRLVKKNTAQVGVVYDWNGADESYVARIEQEHKEWQALLTRGAVTPKNLKPCSEFTDEYFAQWFDRKEDTYGYALPFEFPLRLRPAATTLMTGDNGSGKSTMLCLMANAVAKQLDVDAGEKVVMASMEMRCATTLWIMARQLLGVGKLERTPENESLIASALAWLNARVLLYDFLGITNQHELLNAFEYGAEHVNGKFFILDNMMKVGIADDDYAAQGQFIQRVCDFNLKRGTHTVVVVHENKGDGSAKQKVRGSKQLTDAPDNVVGMQRNEKKAAKIEELKAELRAKKIDFNQYESAVGGMRFEWDSKFLLSKQRYPGAQQNGSKWLYFDKQSLQLVTDAGEPSLPMIHLPKSRQ